MRRLEDLTGKTLGRWFVIGRLQTVRRKHDNRAWWLCRCGCEKGTTKAISSKVLLNGKSTSCGCRRVEVGRVRLTGNTFSCKPAGTADLNRIIGWYKKNAETRSATRVKKGRSPLLWLLSDKEAAMLLSGNCYYCGDSPRVAKSKKVKHGGFAKTGIDRIDPNDNYTVRNCVSCCKKCNMAKMEMTKSDFVAWIKQVYRHMAIKQDVA